MLNPWRERAMLIIGGLLVGLLLIEIVLRVIGFDYPTLYVADARHGYRLLPNAGGWWTTEGNTYVRINADGWRDKEHAKQKPPDTFRIAILGDSFAEAFQVSQEETFWYQMEQSLNDQDCFNGQRVEVLNFGVGGYGTAQQLLVLQHEVWTYDPDLIMLALFVGNDIKNNLYDLNQQSEYAYFAHIDNQLMLDPAFPKNDFLRLRQIFGYSSNYIRLLSIFHILREALQSWQQPPAPVDAWVEVGIDNLVFKPPRSEAWAIAWRVTEDLLVMMRDEVTLHNAELLIVTLSTGISAHPNPEVRSQFLQQMAVEDLFYPDERIQDMATRERIPVLSLAKPFQTYAEQHQVFLHGFENAHLGSGHWNQAGHQLAGELITQKLCE